MDATERTYSVAIGPIMSEKLPSGDPGWAEFNASFENVELPQVEIAARLYDGHPITTQHKDHWRATKNYLRGQHIGMDFDTGDERSTISRLLKDPFIAKYASIIYTTPSHTPDAPRARVLFLLDQPIHQAQNYALSSAALLWLFGSADRQCKDPARFFYGGKPGACEMEWLARELPLATLKDVIARYRTIGQPKRHNAGECYAGRTPDEAKVIAALQHIDAWGIDYDQWVRILMAIHSEFPGDDGLRMAESWAQGREGEVPQKWRSFQPHGNGTGRVGIGTLFAIAGERGWQAEQTA
jgi:hypothetical protein